MRGFRQYLYDDAGRAYLDVYNNVPLVGHGHPRVVRAAQQQLALLNTNTRYLHDLLVRYARRLTRLLPEPLRVCYFVNSGSEANELALRLARAATGGHDVIVLEHAYHGHTTTLVDVSPYKFLGPGGTGQREWVHVAPLPDGYRGRYRRDDPQAGPKYADEVGAIASRLAGEGRRLAAFLSETLPSVAGQVVFPPGYLADAYRHARAAGGVAIADEVQTGFGRLGDAFWGFETQEAVPDIVVLGKPIANGFPLGAVVTTRAIAEAFDNGMEFFSTFGGNPVACAAGLAVLDVLEDEKLQENARRVGGSLARGLRELAGRHPLIGDVRGAGLFLGRRAGPGPGLARAGDGGSRLRREPPARAWRAHRHRRPVRERPQAAAAARLLGRRRRALPRGARRGAAGRRGDGLVARDRSVARRPQRFLGLREDSLAQVGMERSREMGIVVVVQPRVVARRSPALRRPRCCNARPRLLLSPGRAGKEGARPSQFALGPRAKGEGCPAQGRVRG